MKRIKTFVKREASKQFILSKTVFSAAFVRRSLTFIFIFEYCLLIDFKRTHFLDMSLKNSAMMTYFTYPMRIVFITECRLR